jgi:hypothetical protein
MRASTPLVPKDPDAGLQVLLLGRVSTPHQDIANIEAGYEYAKCHLQYHYQGPMHVKELGEQGSGMLTERRTIVEAIDEIATGRWDVVLMEDASKPYRNPRWIYAFIQDAVDMGCRVIAPGDNLDTSEENWEVNLGAAALRHGLHIPDTRRRVRRTATFAFHRGGMAAKYRFGYRKLTKEEADSGQFGPKGLRLAKVPGCTPIIHEMRRRRLAGDTRNAIADWLNGEGIRRGPYVKRGRWTGKLVDDHLRDPIYSGTRTLRDTIYEPVFKTGKHRRRKNPNPETEYYPELAHMTQEEQQELIAYLDQEAAKHRTKAGPQHPLYRRPRSRSIWPGQHARCAVCAGRMYRSGKHLKCENALANGPRSCWNHVQVDYQQVRDKVLGWVFSVLDQHPQFREVLIASAWQEYQRLRGRWQQSGAAVDERIADLKKQAGNLAKAIAQGGHLEALVSELATVQAALQIAESERSRLENEGNEAGGFQSPEEVAARPGRCHSDPGRPFSGFRRPSAALDSGIHYSAGSGPRLLAGPATGPVDLTPGRVV